MDMFGYDMGGDCCEIEIKAAYYDFCKEITKESKVNKHKAYKINSKTGKGFCPTRFYFIVPEQKKELVLKRMEIHFPKYGLITWNQLTKQYQIVKKSERLTEKKFNGTVLNHNYKKAYQEALEGM